MVIGGPWASKKATRAAASSRAPPRNTHVVVDEDEKFFGRVFLFVNLGSLISRYLLGKCEPLVSEHAQDFYFAPETFS